MKQYAVLNPNDGSYTRVDTIEDAIVKSAENACAFFMTHTHGAPFSVVEIDDSGAETWYSASGELIESPDEMQARIEAELRARFRETEPYINAGVIPSTTL